MEDYEKLYKSKEITNVEYAKAVFGEKVLDENYGMGIVYRALHLEKEEYFKSAKLSTLSELIKKYSLDIGPQELNKILLSERVDMFFDKYDWILYKILIPEFYDCLNLE